VHHWNQGCCLGKTALWATARDTRFSAVIASCSGEGGAALSRRNFGETVARLTAPTRFPYQFSESYGLFTSHIHHLPVEANLLLSLIAPRPLLLQTVSEDLWSDPKGEFLAAVDASRVYEFLGTEGLQISLWPVAGEPVWGYPQLLYARGRPRNPALRLGDLYGVFKNSFDKSKNR